MVVRNGKIFLSLREIEPQSPYSADYLRIRILQKKLRGIKIGREWYTTKEWLETYLSRYAIRSIQEQFTHPAEGAPTVPAASPAPARAAEERGAPMAWPAPQPSPASSPSARKFLPSISKRLAAIPAVALLVFVLAYPAARGALNRVGAFLIEYPVPDISALPGQIFSGLNRTRGLKREVLRRTPAAALQIRSGVVRIHGGLLGAGHAIPKHIGGFADRIGTTAIEVEVPPFSFSLLSRIRPFADRVGGFVLEGTAPPIGERARAAAQAIMVGVPRGAERAVARISDRVGRLAVETEIPAPRKIAGGALERFGDWDKAFERSLEGIARDLDGVFSASRVGIAAVGGGFAAAGSGITALERVIDQNAPQVAGSALSGLSRSVAAIERGIETEGAAAAGFIFSEIARSAKEALFQFPGRLAELAGLKQPREAPSRLGWQEVGVEEDSAVAAALPAAGPPRAGLPASAEAVAGRPAPDREVTRVREVVETREVVRTADLAELDRRLNELNAGIRSQVNKLVGDVAALYEGPEAKVSIVRAFAPSQSVDRLSNVTFSGSNTFNLTDADIPDNISVSGYLGTGGGTISGALFASSTLQATGAARLYDDLTVDGVLTVSGTGTSTFAGPLTVNGTTFTIAATTTATNQFTVTRAPNSAHTFASWSVGVAGSNVADASVYINPASAAGDTNLLGIAIAGGARFLVDAEGDVFANSVTLSGGSTLATTTISGNVTIEGNATLGDAANADTHAIRGAAILYATTSSAGLSIWNSTRAGDLLRLQTGATSPTTEFVFTAAGQAAFGTTTPSGTSVLTIGATSTPSVLLTLKGVTGQSANLFQILNSADAGLLAVDSSGRLGIGTSTPGSLLSVHGPALIVGTSTIMGGVLTPSISATGTLGFYAAGADAPRLLIDTSGNAGIGSTTPGARLAVSGAGLFEGTVIASRFQGTSTAASFFNFASSTSLSLSNLLNVSGAGTSTFSGGLTTGLSLGVGTTAPSGFYAAGISGPLLYGGAGATSTNIGAEDIKQHLRVGSLEIVGACQGCGGGGATPGGSDTQLQFNDGGSALGGASNFVFLKANNRVGIGTTTPGFTFAVGGPTYFDTNFIQYGSSTASTLTFNYLRAATSTIPNNASFAWTIATSTAASPVVRVDTENGGTVVIGGRGTGGGVRGEVIVGDVGLPADLVFEESATIHGQGANTLTFGQEGDILNFAVNTGFGSTTPGARLAVSGAGLFGGTVIASRFQGTSTAASFFNFASSTSLSLSNLLNVNGLGTSTFSGGLTVSGTLGIGTTSPSGFYRAGFSGPILFGAGTSTNIGSQSITQNLAVKGNLEILGSSLFQNLNIAGSGTSTFTGGMQAAGLDSSRGLRVSTGDTILAGGLNVTGASILPIASSTSFSVSNLLTVSGAGTSTISGGLTIATSNGTVGIGSSTPALALSVAGMVNLNLVDGGSAAVCHTNALTTTEGVTLGDCTGAPAQDYAELYPTGSDVEFGDILVPDPGHLTETRPTAEIGSSTIAALVRSSRPYEPAVVGIASNNYGDFTSTGHGTIQERDHPMPVALNGRVPVKVSTEGGPIKPGDRITTSSLPGIGMKATTSGPAIGVALAPFDGPVGADCSPSTSSGTMYSCGKIFVFVNLGYSRIDSGLAHVANGGTPWSVDPDTGRVVMAYGLDLLGSDIANARAIFSANGAWSIDESGKLVAKEIETGKLTVKEETRVGSAERPRGITLYDFDTGQPNCVFVQGGQMRSVPGECTFSSPAGGSNQQPATSNQPPPPAESAPPPAEEPQPELPPEDNPAVTESAPEPTPEPSPPSEPAPESAPAPAEEPPSAPEPTPPPSEPVAEPAPSDSAPAADQTI